MTVSDRELLLRDFIIRINRWLEAKHRPELIIALLKDQYGARHRFANGTYVLRLAGVQATCTAGGYNLLRAWCRKAGRCLEDIQA